MSLRLYYFHDPMCSWCWAFRPTWQALVEGLPVHVATQRILGGLAPDTDQPMSAEMQAKLRAIWGKIQHAVPGTPFNFDFWDKCSPRRSTYAACRAVIAARRCKAQFEEAMILKIQQAYYLEARNPADLSTLVELAVELGLDRRRICSDLIDPAIQQELSEEIEFTRSLGVTEFPTLMMEQKGSLSRIRLEYGNAEAIYQQVCGG